MTCIDLFRVGLLSFVGYLFAVVFVNQSGWGLIPACFSFFLGWITAGVTMSVYSMLFESGKEAAKQNELAERILNVLMFLSILAAGAGVGLIWHNSWFVH